MHPLYDRDARDAAAVLSVCGKYRYELRRIWQPGGRNVVFVMLNPSTADAEKDDPTIRRCVDFGKRWGYGGLIVVNLFAVRATQPTAMRAADDPVGPENHTHVKRILDHAYMTGADVVCAWGTHGDYMDQDLTMLGWIEYSFGRLKPKCLGVTQAGHPRHPLYAKASTSLQPYAGRR